MQDISIELNKSQGAAYTTAAKEVFLIGGLGGGKSFWLGQKILQKASVPGSLGFLGAPTLDTLRNSTWPQIQESFSKVGIEEGTDYVINIRPDEFEGVESFSKLSSNRIVTFAWGSYLLLDGLENFNKLRGTQFDYMAIDEFRDVKENARKVVLGRLRGSRYKVLQEQYKKEQEAKLNECETKEQATAILDEYEYLIDLVKYQVLYATTPPDDPEYLIKLSNKQNKDLKFYLTTSFDNKDNLPEGYIENLAEQYDATEYRREIKGELVRNKAKRPFLHSFDSDRHIGNRAMYIPGETIRLSFDFNVDPMTCIAGHIMQSNSEYEIVHIFKAWSMENGNTEKLSYKIKHWLDTFGDSSMVLVTGDATGNSRHASQRDNLTNYEQIKNILELSDNQIQVTKSNPGIKSNRQLCNKIIIRSADFCINSECEELIRDCELVEVDEKGNILKHDRSKEEQRADLLDCLRYFIDTWLRHHLYKK